MVLDSANVRIKFDYPTLIRDYFQFIPNYSSLFLVIPIFVRVILPFIFYAENGSKSCSTAILYVYLCVNLNIKTIMKTNMKKLLVIVMALMPSLSILAMNPSVLDLMPEPDDIPITPMPDPFPGHEPRIMSVGATGDNDGGPIDLGLGGVRPRSGGDHVEEEKNQSVELKLENPRPRGDDGGYDDGGDDDGNYGEPLINLHNGGTIPRSGDHQGEPIAIKGSTPRPRSVAETPYCYHYEGVVYIEADNTITHINASVTRYADNQVWSNAASTNTLSINASDASGTYLLELTLSDGCTYIGEYTIE